MADEHDGLDAADGGFRIFICGVREWSWYERGFCFRKFVGGAGQRRGSVSAGGGHGDRRFVRRNGGVFFNKQTGEVWRKSNSNHYGKGEWKVGIHGKPPEPSHKLTVDANGKLIKIDK